MQPVTLITQTFKARSRLLASGINHDSAEQPDGDAQAEGCQLGDPPSGGGDQIQDHQDQVIVFGGLRILPDRYQIDIDGILRTISQAQMAVLMLMARRPERVFTYDDIRAAVQTGHDDLSDSAVRSVVYRLRKQMGRYRKLIHAVRGIGYVIRQEQSQPNHILAWPLYAYLIKPLRRVWPAGKSGLIGSMPLIIGGAAVIAISFAVVAPRYAAPIRHSASTATAFGPHHVALARQHGIQQPATLEHGIGSAITASTQPGVYFTLAHPHPQEVGAPTRLHKLVIVLEGRSLQFFAEDSFRLQRHDRRSEVRPFGSPAPQVFKQVSRSPPTAAVRALPNGHLLVIDPDGRAVNEHGPDGAYIRSWEVPSSVTKSERTGQDWSVDHLAPRPLENLCVTPDGTVLACGRVSTWRDSTHPNASIRLFVLRQGAVERPAYYTLPLSNYTATVHELLSWDDHTLLLLERDTKGRQTLALIYLTHPNSPLKSVARQDLGDISRLLEDRDGTPKIEGIALGPVMTGGRRMLLALDDRSAIHNQSNRLHAFLLNPDMFTPKE